MILTMIVLAGTVALLYAPLLPMPLTGDSYQWIQHAHLAAHQPGVLFEDLDTFYRPSTTWTLVADRFLWGGFEARGYRVSSLALHGLVALALVVAGRRLGLGWLAAAMVGLVWVTSPFTDESAIVVAYRFQPLLLLSWLVLVAIWPREDETWGRARLAAAIMIVIAAAASKETWVVTPVLVAVLEFERRRSVRGALFPAAAVGCAVAAYMVFYFVAFPGSKSYFEPGPHILARIPSQLAAFLYLEQPMPDAFFLSWRAVFAVAVVGAVVAACLKWRVRGSLVAMCLLILPTLPTILVAFMPQRYLAIPYAGFLLLAGLWVNALRTRFPKWQASIRAVVGAATVLVVAAGAMVVRADLEDYRSVSAAHAMLLEEAVGVAATVVGGEPVVVIRDEQESPLLEVAHAPAGYPKLVYIRNHDPYGLIDTAALFEWVLADEGTRVEHVAAWDSVIDGSAGVVLAHFDGGFVNFGTAPDLAMEATRWSDAGRSVRVIQAVALD